MLLRPGGGGRLAAVAIVPYSAGAALGRTAGVALHPGHLRPLSLPLSAFHSSERGPHSTLRAVPQGQQWQQRGAERPFLLRTRCGASTGAGAGPGEPKGSSSKGRAPLQQRAPVPRPPQPQVLPEPPTPEPPIGPPSAGPSSNPGGGGRSRDPWAAVQQQQHSFQDQHHHQQRQHRQLQHHGRPGRASRERDGSMDASTRGINANSDSSSDGASILDDFLGQPGGARGAADGASRGGDAAARSSRGEATQEQEATRGEGQVWEGEGQRGGDSAMGGLGGTEPRSTSSRSTAGVPREWYAQLSPEWVPEKEFRRAMASAPQDVPGPGAAASGAAPQGVVRGDEGSGAGHLWGAQGEGHRGSAQRGRRHGGPHSEAEARLEHENVRRTLYNFLHSKYATGEELCARDVVFVAENVLCFHPKAASKMGAGVTGMKVDVHPLFPDTKCFFVRSLDRPDWEDFSYLKCLEARRRGVLAARAQEAAREELKEGLGAAGGASAAAEAGEGAVSDHQAVQREEQGEGVGQAEAARGALSSDSGRHSDGHSGTDRHRSSGTDSGRSLEAGRGGSQQPGDGLASPEPSEAGQASGMPQTNGRLGNGASKTGHTSGVPLEMATGHASGGFSQGQSANGHAGNSNGQVTSGQSASDGAPSDGQHAKVDGHDDQVDSETVVYL